MSLTKQRLRPLGYCAPYSEKPDFGPVQIDQEELLRLGGIEISAVVFLWVLWFFTHTA